MSVLNSRSMALACALGSVIACSKPRTDSGSDQDSRPVWEVVISSVDRAKDVDQAGAGDRAVRKASDGTEVFSKKGNVYCSVEVLGINRPGNDSDFTKTRGEELSKKLGALCTVPLLGSPPWTSMMQPRRRHS